MVLVDRIDWDKVEREEIEYEIGPQDHRRTDPFLLAMHKDPVAVVRGQRPEVDAFWYLLHYGDRVKRWAEGHEMEPCMLYPYWTGEINAMCMKHDHELSAEQFENSRSNHSDFLRSILRYGKDDSTSSFSRIIDVETDRETGEKNFYFIRTSGLQRGTTEHRCPVEDTVIVCLVGEAINDSDDYWRDGVIPEHTNINLRNEHACVSYCASNDIKSNPVQQRLEVE